MDAHKCLICGKYYFGEKCPFCKGPEKIIPDNIDDMDIMDFLGLGKEKE